MLDVAINRLFAKVPAIVWAMLLDLEDYIYFIFSIPIAATFVGIAFLPILDLINDIIQIIFALSIFKNKKIAILTPDIILPPPFDLFPSYTAVVIYKTYFNR